MTAPVSNTSLSPATTALLAAMAEVDRLSDEDIGRSGPWGHGLLRTRTCFDCRPPGAGGCNGVIGWTGPAACICDPPKTLADAVEGESVLP